MNAAHKRAQHNFDAARAAVMDIVTHVPTSLHGERLVLALSEVLSPYLSDRPTPNESTLCGIAVMALARLVELERGEKELST